MQSTPTPTYLKPQPRVSNGYGYNLNNLGNINFSGLGAGIGDQVAKLRNLLKARGIAAPAASNPMNYDYDGDGSIVTYTRQQFDDLYKTNIKRSSLYSGADNGGEGGYFDKLFFMFQLYIAFINALMNAANMSASFIFGNGSLQKIFSVFLVNVLSMILKTNVADLTAEELRDLLQKNRPVLQQISTIIIDEASQLLVGLSEVCSKIAMDWVQNVLPGLVKSAAIGIPSALEAAIPPLGEVVEIVNTGLALMGSFMKMVGAVQRNVDSVSQGVGHVKSAYDSLQKVRDLLNKDTSEIVKTATSAVVGPELNVAAQNFLTSVSQPPVTVAPMPAAPLEPQSATPVVAPSPSSPSHMRNLFNIGKNVVTDAAKNVARQGVNRVSSAISNLLVTPSGALRQQKAGATSRGGGNRRIETSKAKHRKYLKNTRHFNRYISNLRKKTAKKELELVNSMQELKSM